MRPIDQGFQESLVLKGGGIGQPSDPPGGTHYFDPILQHNGKPETRKGYCTDIFTDAAIDFIAERRQTRAVLRLPRLQRPARAARGARVVPRAVREGRPLARPVSQPVGYPLPGPAPADVTARVYGMVTNIDDNLGRLFAKLDELGVWPTTRSSSS